MLSALLQKIKNLFSGKEKSAYYIKCLNCDWIHFAISRRKAEAEVKKFNQYFETLSETDQQFFYGGEGSCIDNYLRCQRCGVSSSFIPATEKEVEAIYGSTISPIAYF